MRSKNHIIIEAAIDVLSRYGTRRTTIGDIAEKAGISRQTLYSYYTSKEEILAAAVACVGEKSVAAIEAGWAQTESISEKLDIYFQHAVINLFAKLKAMPDSGDLLASSNEAAAKELDAVYGKKRRLWSEVLQPYRERLAGKNSSPEKLADFIENSTRNYKYSATDEEHLMSLLATLKLSVLVMLDEPPPV